jgi:ABC-2 type transport system permease protein
MNNFWTVLGYTYMSKLKSKQFIISTIITLVLILALTNISKIIDYFESEEKVTVAVKDETEEFFALFKDQMSNINEDIHIVQTTEQEEELSDKVTEGELEGYLIIQQDDQALIKGLYKSESIADSSIANELQTALHQVKTFVAANKLDLTNEQLLLLNSPVQFDREALQANAKSEEELSQTRGMVYVMLFVIYFLVILYANMIAMEVATEKSSRVMEILISSVSPITQMFAKIFAIALVSLTQLIVWIGVGYFSIKQNLETMSGGFFTFFGFQDTQLSTIIYGVVFCLLGYLLYATMAAFLGSLVTRIEDVQQMITPMIMFVVAGFMLAVFGLDNPEASFVTVTSYIPFFTPMLMFLRVGMLDLPLWEGFLGIGILIITIVLLAIFGAKVYKGGVLMYGQSGALKDIKKALQLTKNK